MSKKTTNNAMNDPRVSVIMNCLNCEKYVKEAIDSVYAQSYKNWEIIFWDNASLDKSAKIIESYDDRLRYFYGKETLTLGAARNSAILRSRGEFIAFLDCDDLWLPEKLEKQIPLFDKERVGLVFCDTIYFSDKGKIKQLYSNKPPPRGRVFKYLLRNYFLSMETVVIRKKALEDLPEWFDHRFNIIEEADLFLRIAHDWELDYVNEPLAKWRVHNGSWTFRKKHLFPQERELLLYKLCNLYDEFQDNYAPEINKIKAKNQYQFALLDWEKGNNHNVRRRLKPYLISQMRYILPYLMSFFPYRLYRRFFEFKP